jgi:hypothetical protein
VSSLQDGSISLQAPRPPDGDPLAAQRAPFGPVLALSVALAAGAFLVLMAAVLLIVHPPGRGLLAFAIRQNQNAKTVLYLAAFACVAPLVLVLVPRLADRIARGPQRSTLSPLAATLNGSLAGALVLDRLLAAASVRGLGVLAITLLVWWAGATALLARAVDPRPWRAGQAAARRLGLLTCAAAGLAVAVLAGLTDLHGLSAAGVLIGVLVAVAGSVVGRRRTLPQLVGARGLAWDALVVVVLLLAIPNVVVFHPAAAAPDSFLEPGIIQFHQDFLLGPANQLLGGGALLVSVPVSQYGVGFIYFLAAWFHLVPIGYGTYGLIDGLTSAVFYMAGYAVLRLAGVGRAMSGAVSAFAVLTLVYHFYYAIGELPQQGALRFGLPMLVILGILMTPRGGLRALLGHGLAFVALALAAVWAIESLVYTAFVYAALAATQACVFAPAGRRLESLARAGGFGVAAVLSGHLVLALGTLIGSGQLPDWGQYLYYVRALVLGGTSAGQISYGFADWSPGLAVGAAGLASMLALVLWIRRAPAMARHHRLLVLALSGLTAYSVALLSYTDNRSSTYLLPYVALPLLLGCALWLWVLRRLAPGMPAWGARLGGVVALAVAVLMLGAAWPTIGARFSVSALAHAYPGGGLRAALQRLLHPPAIDPRAPEGERLLDRFSRGASTLVLLPDWPDLATEILIRSHRRNALFIGDPKADAFIDSRAWTGKLGEQIEHLPVGTRILTDASGLSVVARLRGRPDAYAIVHPLDQLNPQLEWILHRLDERFTLVPVARSGSGYVVAELRARG